MSKGQFQFDLWNFTPKGNRYDWETLRKDVMQHGVRNSLLLSPMPTASTSQILGNNESFEPYTSNVYTRRVLAGEFICVNPHLVEDMIKANLWTSEVKNALIGHNGSIQNIKGIPDRLKKIYKTSWELSQKRMIDLSVARGPFICQSQSLNLYMGDPTFAKLSSMHFYSWKQGLKTGQYYLRTRPARDAIKFTVNIADLLKASEEGNNGELLKVLNTQNKAEKNLKKRRVATEPTEQEPEAKRPQLE